jgi:hypothetical protein
VAWGIHFCLWLDVNGGWWLSNPITLFGLWNVERNSIEWRDSTYINSE